MDGLKEFFSKVAKWMQIPNVDFIDVLEIIIIAFILPLISN